MGSIYFDSLGVQYCASLDPSSEDTWISTSVDFISTCHQSIIVDVEYVNHVSHDDDWFHHTLIQTHELEPHPPCGHYISPQCLGKGASTFGSSREAILPKPHASSSVKSCTIILPHS